MHLTPEDIKVISRLVDDLCGIVLDESKGYLIESRLRKVAKASGCKTFSELYYKARYDDNVALRSDIINAITTNETLFFRDTSPFDVLQFKVIPDLIDARAKSPNPRRLEFWSAACSTGQEPYSLAMTLREMIPDADAWNIRITATDISEAAVAQAKRGAYSDFEIQRGMKQELLEKYFTRTTDGWCVTDRIRKMIEFRTLNLHEPFPCIGPFDVILCRNVAIYFSAPARKKLFERLTQMLAPDGALLVGASESLTDIGYEPLHHCRAVYYQPRKHARRPAAALC